MELLIHVDGGSRGNPGPAAAGVVIQHADTKAVLHQAGYFLGRTTNNVAEYHGLIRALEAAGRLGGRTLRIHSDSQLMVQQVNGEFRVKSPVLRPLFERAQGLLAGFAGWSMRHVYREGNTLADEMANRAMDAGRDVVVCGKAAGTVPTGNPHAAAGKSTDPSVDAAASPAPCAPASPAGRCAVRLVVAGTGPCPAPGAVDQTWVLDATTPAGLCVHAAHAALSQWLDHPRQGLWAQRTTCRRCGAVLLVQSAD